VSPAAAVLESYSRVEQQLRAMLAAAGVSIDEAAWAVQMARVAEEQGVITKETREAIEGLSVLRNLAGHGHTEVDPARALDYAALSDAVLYAMRRSGGTASKNTPS
jgi:uncharacterized protein YutE (UPF0331/DUF86 family)